MNQQNGSRSGRASAAIEESSPNLEKKAEPQQSPIEQLPPLATRGKQRAREEFKQNRFVIVAAGGLVFALLVLAFASAPKLNRRAKSPANPRATVQATTAQPTPASESLLPVIDSGRPAAGESHDGEVTEQDLQRTVTRRVAKAYGSMPPAAEVGSPGSLGSIPPFGEQGGRVPPYQPGMNQIRL